MPGLQPQPDSAENRPGEAIGHTDIDAFLKMEGRLIPKAELTPEEEIYYNYTCQEGDYIKTCTVPSPKLDESDLEREKKMLKI